MALTRLGVMGPWAAYDAFAPKGFLGVVVDLCELGVISAMPTVGVVSLMPESSVVSLMPTLTVAPFCATEDDES